MYPVDFLRVLAVAFVTLFPVVNPVGGGPIFLALTRQYPQSAQRMLARKIAAYGFILLSTSMLFGSIVLNFFGIFGGGADLWRPGSRRYGLEPANPKGTGLPLR